MLPIAERTCPVCEKLSSNQNHLDEQFSVEDEIYFVFQCKAYSSLRNKWLSSMPLPDSFNTMNQFEKFSLVLNDDLYIKQTVKFIQQAFDMRNQILNS